MWLFVFIFFCKQKTAYEMRISDWSSDVCSSDLGYDLLMRLMEAQKVTVEQGDMLCLYTGFGDVVMAMQKKPDLHRLENSCAVLDGRDAKLLNWITDSGQIGRESGRERVCPSV